MKYILVVYLMLLAKVNTIPLQSHGLWQVMYSAVGKN